MLHDELKKLDKYPFHMPGHKRNEKFNIAGSEIDITEIDGFDSLHAPKGVLLEVENELAEIYKAKKSFALVNGSTVGILAAIFAVCDEGDKIIIARNCHKSVYNACMLRKLRVVYAEPEFDAINGFYTKLSQDGLDEVISKNGDAKAVVITSPTYEGRISEIKTSLPLIIDAAHGAHLGIHYFPNYPKGSIVVSSLHKTLPALTQCAVANVYDDKYVERVKRYIDIFETSSPSYVLLNSISICCDLVKNHRELFKRYYSELCDFRMIEFEHLMLKYSEDISKIVISSENTGLSGSELSGILRDKYDIEAEMASVNYVILMTSVGDEKEAFNRLGAALKEIDWDLTTCSAQPFKKPPLPESEMIISVSDESEEVELKSAIGKTSNEFVFAYPPDIPIITPNEIISKETVNYIDSLLKSGVNVVSDSGLLNNKILTKMV